jgi:hypothetical protein
MMGVDDIQFQFGDQLIYEGRDRDRGRDIPCQGQVQAGVAEDEWLSVFVIILLREDEHVVPHTA